MKLPKVLFAPFPIFPRISLTQWLIEQLTEIIFKRTAIRVNRVLIKQAILGYPINDMKYYYRLKRGTRALSVWYFLTFDILFDAAICAGTIIYIDFTIYASGELLARYTYTCIYMFMKYSTYIHAIYIVLSSWIKSKLILPRNKFNLSL